MSKKNAKQIKVGQVVGILPGQVVQRFDGRYTQQRATAVTVRRLEAARDGKTRIFWKSGGYEASALIA